MGDWAKNKKVIRMKMCCEGDKKVVTMKRQK